MATTLTQKGQVTIPKRVRDHLGLRPGSAVVFTLDDDGRVVVTKEGVQAEAPPAPDRFAKWVGSNKCGMTTDEIMQLLRGDD